MKDIEALAKIGEKIVLGKLSNSLNIITNGLAFRKEDLRDRWKSEFKRGVESYKEERDKAISLGLDISDYEKEFLGLTNRYSEITGEKI